MLIICRHGRTEANRDGLLLGRLDVDLDDTGRAQADALATSIDNVDRLVSSPLRRTVQTARRIGGDAVGIEQDERWIELDYGSYDGTPMRDVPTDVWRRWRADLDFRPPGGESIAALGRRVRDGADALAADAVDGDVVVVTHVSPIKAAVAWGLDVSDAVAWRMFVAPASVTRLAIRSDGDDVRASLVAFNDVSHLS